ncbi:MAG: cell division protein FtsQ/DivIB, partial [Georgenia sp.]
RVSTGGVADRLGELPAVQDVRVVRAWPRGLTVTVVARVPVAAAASAEGWVLVDADGVRIATVAAVPEGLPEVTVPLETSAETAPAVSAVLTVLGALPEDLIGQVAQAGATGSAQVTLVLDDGALVRWGSAEENALKIEVLRVLRQQPTSVYDVSAPRAPTTS